METPHRRRRFLIFWGRSKFLTEASSDHSTNDLQNESANIAAELTLQTSHPETFPQPQEAELSRRMQQHFAELGFTKEQAKHLCELDVTLEMVRDLIQITPSHEHVTTFLEHQFSPSMIECWIREGFSIDESVSWIKSTFLDPTTALKWKACHFTSDLARQWREAGIDFAEIAALWRDASLSPYQARGTLASILELNPEISIAPDFVWKPSIDFLRTIQPGLIRLWLIAPISKETDAWKNRAAWILAGADPDNALRWTDLGISPTNAGELSKYGLSSNDVLLLMLKNFLYRGQESNLLHLGRKGLDFQRDEFWLLVQKRWTAEEFLHATDAGASFEDIFQLGQQGLPSGTIVSWLQHGFSPADIRDWTTNGLDNPQSMDFLASLSANGYSQKEIVELIKSGLSSTSFSDWSIRGFGAAPMIEWVQAGVSNPAWAEYWIVSGFNPETYSKSASGSDFQVARNWQAYGYTPDEMKGWISLGTKRHEADLWKDQGISFEEAQQWLAAGVSRPSSTRVWRELGQSPQAASNWIRLGLGPKEFIQLRGKLPTRASTSISQPSPTSTPESSASKTPVSSTAVPKNYALTHFSFDAWVAQGATHIDALGDVARSEDAFLRHLFDHNFGWLTSSQMFPNQVRGPDWLDEILVRADLLRDRVRKTVSEPSLFDGSDLQIVLAVRQRLAIAWVGIGGRGTLTAFALPSCRPLTKTDSSLSRLAVGYAISWFLDLSVSLTVKTKSTRSHPHFQMQGSSSPASHRPLIRYVPTPRFEEHRRKISSKQLQLRPTHRVEGHVRTLPGGWKPSEEARENAPAYMSLGPNETFVRSHLRGAEIAATELIRHLSKYSALAEAIGATG